MWVLIETIATKKNNKPYYLLAQTSIGPATTSYVDHALKFATRQEAIEHPAYYHFLTNFQPLELVESVEPVLVSYSVAVPLPSGEFGIFTVTRLPQFDRPWPDGMEVSGPAERFPATPEGWKNACELAGRRNGFVEDDPMPSLRGTAHGAPPPDNYMDMALARPGALVKFMDLDYLVCDDGVYRVVQVDGKWKVSYFKEPNSTADLVRLALESAREPKHNKEGD